MSVFPFEVALRIVERAAQRRDQRPDIGRLHRCNLDAIDRLGRRYRKAVLGIRLFARLGERPFGAVVGAETNLPPAVDVNPVRLQDAQRTSLEGGRAWLVQPRLPCLERTGRSPPPPRHAAQVDRDGDVERRRGPRTAPVLAVERGERDDHAITAEHADTERAAPRLRVQRGDQRHRRHASRDRAQGSRRHRGGVYSRLRLKETV